MNHKVLLADDSLTIQKVIKITLANQPYDITDCSSEDELFSVLAEVKPKIVFLDFNLSENKSGYDLCSRIKKESPHSKVLMLLGTFDTVDDKLFERCGASDKIVKPFDSNKFISICKELVRQNVAVDEELEVNVPSDEDLEFPDIISTEENDELDQWEVSSTSKSTFKAESSEPINVIPHEPKLVNPLEQQISDWGMSVPGVITSQSQDQDLPELPPIIDFKEKSHSPLVDENKLPSSEDLDYPDMTSKFSSPKTQEKPKSQLVSIENFNEIPVELELQGNYVPDETDVKSIEDQIRDEVEGDLWKADEFEAIKEEVKNKIEEIEEFQVEISVPHNKKEIFDEKMFEPLDKNEKQVRFDLSSSAQLEELVKKYVKEYLDQMFKQSVEKVSWEIIPDLAENLIKRELEKISNKVIDD